jgi:PAS domain S-box-containing protein
MVPPLRVLVVEPDDARYEALASVLAGLGGLAVETERARTQEEALGALRAGRVDVCLAPSEPGPDVAAGLTLRLARAAAFVPVVAVVDDADGGLEAIRDEGAADFLLRRRLDAGGAAAEVARALLVARARREAVEAFRRGQDVLAATLREADLAVIELDEAGLVVRASAGVGPVLGVDPRELVGRLHGVVFEGGAGAAVGALLHEAPDPARRGPLRFRQEREDERAVDWAVSPLADGGAVAVGHPAAARAEDADAPTLLQHVADALPLVVLSADAGGHVRYLGGAALEAFGVTAEDLQGEAVFALLEGGAEGAVYARQALAGEPVEALLTRGGRCFRARFAPLFDAAGRPDGLVMVAHDVTEREEAERTRQRIAHALDAAADAIGLSDVTGTALYVNRAMEALLGYSLEAMNAAGGPPALYADPAVAGAVFDAIRAGERWEGEVTLVARAGHPVRLRLAAAAVYDDAGDLIGLIGIHRPVSD